MFESTKIKKVIDSLIGIGERETSVGLVGIIS